MKKFLSAILVIALCFSVLGTVALADEGDDADDARVTIGANLDAQQRAAIYDYFGIEYGTVKEIIVTNEDEREYLEGLVPESKIGHVALSCIYILTLPEGDGLDITTNNINWCTSEMYANALTTAGITDACVKVNAPWPVSGTAALTGIYKAYEDITGEELSLVAKEVGFEELITTGELAEYIGSTEATEIVNELKKILDQTQNMTDDEVKAEILEIADSYNVKITDAQVDQLLALCRKLEKLDVDELKEKLLTLTNSLEGAKKVEEKVSAFANSVKEFFSNVTGFFARLFGKK